METKRNETKRQSEAKQNNEKHLPCLFVLLDDQLPGGSLFLIFLNLLPDPHGARQGHHPRTYRLYRKLVGKCPYPPLAFYHHAATLRISYAFPHPPIFSPLSFEHLVENCIIVVAQVFICRV